MNLDPPPLADPHSTAPSPRAKASRAPLKAGLIGMVIWTAAVIGFAIPLFQGMLNYGSPRAFDVFLAVEVGFALFVIWLLGFLVMASVRYISSKSQTWRISRR